MSIKKTTLTEFIAYLEKLATFNLDIAHNPVSHPAFVRLYEADNPEMAIRNNIKNLPCVLIKDYDFEFSDSGDNLHKIRNIEFIIVDRLGRSVDKDTVYDVWERTEEIGDEFILRMKYDKRLMWKKEIINFHFTGITGVPVAVGVGNLFGTSYSLRISSARTNDPDGNKWADMPPYQTIDYGPDYTENDYTTESA